MYKNILLSIFFIIILLLSLPFFTGIVVQEKLAIELHQLNSQTVQSKIISYHRGWLSSKAIILLTLPAEKVSSKLVVCIQHGPLFNFNHFNKSTAFGWALFHIKILSSKMKFTKVLPHHKIGNAIIAWHFNNVLIGIFKGLKLNFLQNRQGIMVHSPGTRIDFQYAFGSKRISLHAIIGGLTASWQHHNNLRIPPLLFSMQGRINPAMILLGSMQLHIPLIAWQRGATKILLVQNLNLISDYQLNEARRINYLEQVTIQLLSYRDRSYAPSYWSSIVEVTH